MRETAAVLGIGDRGQLEPQADDPKNLFGVLRDDAAAPWRVEAARAAAAVAA